MRLGTEELLEFVRRFDRLRSASEGRPARLLDKFAALDADTVAAADALLDWFEETGFSSHSTVAVDRIIERAPSGFRLALSNYTEEWEAPLRTFAESTRRQIDIGFVANVTRCLPREGGEVAPSIDARQDSQFQPGVHTLADCVTVLEMAGPRGEDAEEDQNLYSVAVGGVEHLFRRMDSTPMEWDARSLQLDLIVVEGASLRAAGRLKALLLDAMRAYLFGAFLSCSVACRACAEIILKERLNGIVQLSERPGFGELVSKASQSMLRGVKKTDLRKLQKVGNDAAHSINDGAIGAEEAHVCLEVVQRLLKAR
ncbi:MAG: hypothetical protein ABL308_05590 [Oceanicaulis sp.]